MDFKDNIGWPPEIDAKNAGGEVIEQSLSVSISPLNFDVATDVWCNISRSSIARMVPRVVDSRQSEEREPFDWCLVTVNSCYYSS